MTACVNKKSKRVAAVVTASLVGALSIGAPAVALAANANIDMQVAPAEDAFSRGSVTISGSNADSEKLEGEGTKAKPYTIKANGNGSALKISVDSVTPLGGALLPVNATDYKVVITDSNGSEVKDVVKPGNYTVTVEALKGVYAGSKATAHLAVKAASLQNVDIFEANSTVEDKTTDKKLVFTGSELKIGFADKVAFVEGEDYTVKVLKPGTDNVASAPGVSVVEAGDYIAYLTGKGQYAGETKEVKFSVEQFDFSNVSIPAMDIIGSETAPAHPAIVTSGNKGTADYAELDPSLVKLTLKQGPSADGINNLLFDKVGAYTFEASVDVNDSIVYDTAKHDVTVNKIATEAIVKYNDEALANSYFINKKKGEKFDLSKIVAYGDGTELKGACDVSVSTETAADAKNALEQNTSGTYTVTVRVNPTKTGYKFGGTFSFKVKVVEQVIDADANVFVYYDDQAINSFEKVYDGKTIVVDDAFTIKAFDNDGKSVDEDVNFKVYDSDGKKVDNILNAGTYTLKVESDKYELTGTTEVAITVNKVDLSVLKVNALQDWYGAAYLPIKADKSAYLWSELDLRYNAGEEWVNLSKLPANDNIQSDDNLTAEKWDSEKEEWVEVSYKDGRCKTEGRWRITVSANKEVAKNYKFANDDNTTSVEFVVVPTDRLVFRDVKPGEWYFNAVSDAKALQFVAGVSGTPYYQPTAAIKRCDVIVILARMAGVESELLGMKEGQFSTEYGTYLDYTDVDAGAYYARALAWATKVDIAHGSDGSFRPNDTITREEFAALLSNYAMLNGKDVSVDAEKVLAEFPDGASVSDWAANAVAWAADADIMGNGGKLNPGSDITRAEVAAMAVNFQPTMIVK